MAQAITNAHGLITVAAEALGCSEQAVRHRIKTSALVRQALSEARERTLDVAEQSLFRQVENGEGWAVCFILKTLGRSRGYVERQELSGPDGGPVRVRLTWPSPALPEPHHVDA